jgi:hypothetical protein
MGTLEDPVEIVAEVVPKPNDDPARARELAKLAGGPETTVVLRAHLEREPAGRTALKAWDESQQVYEIFHEQAVDVRRLVAVHDAGDLPGWIGLAVKIRTDDASSHDRHQQNLLRTLENLQRFSELRALIGAFNGPTGPVATTG